MIIELTNPGTTSDGDPEGYVVVAQKGVIAIKRVDGDKVTPFREEAPEGDFEVALAATLSTLTGAGYEVVG